VLLWKVPLLQEPSKWSVCQQDKVGRCCDSVAAETPSIPAVQASMGTHVQGRKKCQATIHSFIIMTSCKESYADNARSTERQK